jgi:hypothetical protein
VALNYSESVAQRYPTLASQSTRTDTRVWSRGLASVMSRLRVPAHDDTYFDTDLQTAPSHDSQSSTLLRAISDRRKPEGHFVRAWAQATPRGSLRVIHGPAKDATMLCMPSVMLYSLQRQMSATLLPGMSLFLALQCGFTFHDVLTRT